MCHHQRLRKNLQKEAEFFDFGLRYKLQIITAAANANTTCSSCLLYVSIPEWEEEHCDYKDDAIKRLNDIYGQKSFHAANKHQHQQHPWKNKTKKGMNDDDENPSTPPSYYNFYININDTLVDKFDNCIEDCSTCVSQIRIQCIGSPIYYAMERIILNTNTTNANTIYYEATTKCYHQ